MDHLPRVCIIHRHIVSLMKKIIIAGGSGFLGKHLERYFDGTEYAIKILTRRPTSENHIAWDGKNMGDWVCEIEDCDAVINLCGKSVDCRYTNL